MAHPGLGYVLFMGVTDEWLELLRVLREMSPESLRFRPPATQTEIEHAEESTTGNWPDELKEFFTI